MCKPKVLQAARNGTVAGPRTVCVLPGASASTPLTVSEMDAYLACDARAGPGEPNMCPDLEAKVFEATGCDEECARGGAAWLQASEICKMRPLDVCGFGVAPCPGATPEAARQAAAEAQGPSMTAQMMPADAPVPALALVSEQSTAPSFAGVPAQSPTARLAPLPALSAQPRDAVQMPPAESPAGAATAEQAGAADSMAPSAVLALLLSALVAACGL